MALKAVEIFEKLCEGDVIILCFVRVGGILLMNSVSDASSSLLQQSVYAEFSFRSCKHRLFIFKDS